MRTTRQRARRVFLALLWKDYRVHRSLILFGFLLLVLPYVIGALRLLFGREEWQDIRVSATLGMAFTSLALTLVTMAGLAGAAFTTEREQRSNEFLACLPTKRWHLLLSKVAMMMIVVLSMWLFNLVPLAVLQFRHPMAPSSSDVAAVLAQLAPTGVLLFGVAWGASAWLRRGTLAAACGLAAPIVVAAGLRGLHVTLASEGLKPGASYAWVSLVIGGLAFVAGCVAYMKRFQP